MTLKNYEHLIEVIDDYATHCKVHDLSEEEEQQLRNNMVNEVGLFYFEAMYQENLAKQAQYTRDMLIEEVERLKGNKTDAEN